MPKKLIITLIVLVPVTIFGTILLVGSLGGPTSNDVAQAPVPDLSNLPQTVSTPVPELDPAVVSAGKIVYDQNCATCHGVSAEGQADWKTPNPDGTFKAPPHDDSGHTWHHADDQLIDIITRGPAFYAESGATANMPGFEATLSAAQIESSLTYIKSLWSAENKQSQWDVSNGGSH